VKHMDSRDGASANPVRARGASLVRRVYFPRVLGLGLGAICVGAGLYQHGAPTWAWVLLALNGFAWPHVGYQWAMRSASPYGSEQRNLLIDAASGGFWVPAMGFNLLPSVLILTMLSMDNIAVGGRPLFLKGLLAHLAGATFALLVVDVRFAPASNLTTLVACIPLLVTYPLIVGIVTYRLSQQLSRQKQELRRLTEQDAMSGLYSRSHWEERLRAEFQGFHRHRRAVTLMLADLDQFKVINDRYGHAVGDEVIRHVGQVFREHVRPGDVVGRYGGDEFGVIFPETIAEEARQVAMRIRVALTPSGPLKTVGVTLTMSIGIASLLPRISTCKEWIEHADRALYEVKNHGRDGVRVCADDDLEDVPEASN